MSINECKTSILTLSVLTLGLSSYPSFEEPRCIPRADKELGKGQGKDQVETSCFILCTEFGKSDTYRACKTSNSNGQYFGGCLE